MPWLAEAGLLTYVGRAGRRHAWPGSDWANPFVGLRGDRPAMVRRYREWLPDRPDLMRRLRRGSSRAGRWAAGARRSRATRTCSPSWRGRRAVHADDLGEPVPLDAPPRTVVSLVPSLTDAIETSRPGLVAGATDYCTHPPDLDVPRVGGSKYPRVDDVLALRPDLVVANVEENRPEDVERIRADGIPCGSPPRRPPCRRGSARCAGCSRSAWTSRSPTGWWRRRSCGARCPRCA